jgi:hypothetical protein
MKSPSLGGLGGVASELDAVEHPQVCFRNAIYLAELDGRAFCAVDDNGLPKEVGHGDAPRAGDSVEDVC